MIKYWEGFDTYLKKEINPIAERYKQSISVEHHQLKKKAKIPQILTYLFISLWLMSYFFNLQIINFISVKESGYYLLAAAITAAVWFYIRSSGKESDKADSHIMELICAFKKWSFDRPNDTQPILEKWSASESPISHLINAKLGFKDYLNAINQEITQTIHSHTETSFGLVTELECEVDYIMSSDDSGETLSSTYFNGLVLMAPIAKDFPQLVIYSKDYFNFSTCYGEKDLVNLFQLSEVNLEENLANDYFVLSNEMNQQDISRIIEKISPIGGIKNIAISFMDQQLSIIIDFDNIVLSKGLFDSPSGIKNTVLKFSDLEELVTSYFKISNKSIKQT